MYKLKFQSALPENERFHKRFSKNKRDLYGIIRREFKRLLFNYAYVNIQPPFWSHLTFGDHGVKKN